MPENPHVRRRVPAFGPMLLACLSLVLAVPAGALAAPGDGGACDESRASEALAAGACAESRSSAALGEGSASPDANDERESTGDDDEDPRGDETAEEGTGDGSQSEGHLPRSRADAALEDRESGRSLEEDLDERAEEIRREGRERREATRRRARSAEAAEDSPADEDDAEAVGGNGSDEIIVTTAGSDEAIRLLPGRRDILVRERALIRGYIPARRSGRNVVLEVRVNDRWVEVDRAKTVDDGRFYLAWYPSRPGYFRVRVRPLSTTTSTQPSSPRLLYIYRTAVASWYGPGFYGNTTACGQRFTSSLLGVAHKTLPCGYRLTVRYNGRARTVRVVDRGPYTRGRDYDLTEALRDYLHFDGVDRVWVTA